MKKLFAIVLTIVLVLGGARLVSTARNYGVNVAVGDVITGVETIGTTLGYYRDVLGNWILGVSNSRNTAATQQQLPFATPTPSPVPTATPEVLYQNWATPVPTSTPMPTATVDPEIYFVTPTATPETVDSLPVPGQTVYMTVDGFIWQAQMNNPHGAFNTPHEDVVVYDVDFVDQPQEIIIDMMINKGKISLWCCEEHGKWNIKAANRLPNESTRVKVCYKDDLGITNGDLLLGTIVRVLLTKDDIEELDCCACWWYDTNEYGQQIVVYGLRRCEGHKKSSGGSKATPKPTATPKPADDGGSDDPTPTPTAEPTATPTATPTAKPSATPTPSHNPGRDEQPTPTPSHNSGREPEPESEKTPVPEHNTGRETGTGNIVVPDVNPNEVVPDVQQTSAPIVDDLELGPVDVKETFVSEQPTKQEEPNKQDTVVQEEPAKQENPAHSAGRENEIVQEEVKPSDSLELGEVKSSETHVSVQSDTVEVPAVSQSVDEVKVQTEVIENFSDSLEL